MSNLFEDEHGKVRWWKNCITPGCQHYVCQGYSENHCYLHMSEDARARKDANMGHTATRNT